MNVEFYGEVSEYTKRRVDKVKKRSYARWLAALALLLAAAAVLAGIFRAGWVALAVFAVLLAALAAWMYFSPLKKSMAKEKWLLRICVGEGYIRFVQYRQGNGAERKRPLQAVKRVIKTHYCYYIVFSDVASALICERAMLKSGTIEGFEAQFAGKLQEKEIP